MKLNRKDAVNWTEKENYSHTWLWFFFIRTHIDKMWGKATQHINVFKTFFEIPLFLKNLSTYLYFMTENYLIISRSLSVYNLRCRDTLVFLSAVLQIYHIIYFIYSLPFSLRITAYKIIQTQQDIKQCNTGRIAEIREQCKQKTV